MALLKRALGGVAAMIVAGAASAAWGAPTTTCVAGADAPAGARKPAEAAALGLVQDLLAGRGEAAFARLAPDARADFPREAVDGFSGFLMQMEIQRPEIGWSWFVDAPASDGAMVPCGAGAARIEVASKGGAPEAHVEIVAQGVNDVAVFPVWLEKSGAAWRVRSMGFATKSSAGRDAADFLALARRERAADRRFNAGLLYRRAWAMTQLGEAYRLPASAEIAEEADAMIWPPVLLGDPPYVWKLEGVDYEITQVGPMAIAGELLLHIQWTSEPGLDEAGAEAANRRLLEAFDRAWPQWSQAFSDVAVRGIERGGTRSYGSLLRKSAD